MEFKATWFGFELNHMQSVLLLAIAFIGLLNIPFGILGGVNQLLDAILFTISGHLYPYMFDDLKGPLITIAVYVSFFLLCIYTVWKVLKNDQKSIFKRVSSQQQVTSWFGFKLNHSQSILLFLLSIIGIISITASFFIGLNNFPYSIFFDEFFPDWNIDIQRNLFAGFHLIIFLISFYTIIKMKMNSKNSNIALGLYHPTSIVIAFMVSIIIIIFMVFKLLTTLYFPMVYHEDFDATLLVLFFSSNVASFSYLRKARISRHKQISSSSTEPVGVMGKKANSSKLGLIVLLVSVFLFVVVYFSYLTTNLVMFSDAYPNHFFFNVFLSLIIGSQAYIYTYFITLLIEFFNLLLFSIPFFIIFYFFIGTQRLERDLKVFELEIDEKWMGWHVKIKSYAITIFWISLAQLVFLLVYLYALFPYLSDPFSGTYIFFDTLLLVILIVVISVFCCYNVARFYFVQKLHDKPKYVKSEAHNF